MSRIHYDACPVCGSEKILPLLTVQDHSVSHESFVIWQCGNCTVQFTQDVPDESSIGPYYSSPDYISHTNTNKGLINQLYQRIRKHTLDTKAKLVIALTSRQGRLLDLGAGTGAFANTMNQRQWEVSGIEPDETAREQARMLYNLNLLTPDQLYKHTNASFDAITLWHVLEHVHQLHEYIEQIKKLLAENGKVFIAVPNYQSSDHDDYKLFWAAYDVPRHLYHFTPAAIEVLANSHGLKMIRRQPMWFDSYYISLLSSRYKNGRTHWIGAGVAGLKSTINTLFDNDKASSLIYVLEKG